MCTQPLNSLVTSRSGHEAAVKMVVSCGKISRERVCNMAVEQVVVCTVECMLIIAHISLVPRPPSEKSRKGLVTRMAMRCPRGLYTRANQIAEIIYITFNRGCANSLVYGDRHGVQLTKAVKVSGGRIRYGTLIPKH